MSEPLLPTLAIQPGEAGGGASGFHLALPSQTSETGHRRQQASGDGHLAGLELIWSASGDQGVESLMTGVAANVTASGSRVAAKSLLPNVRAAELAERHGICMRNSVHRERMSGGS